MNRPVQARLSASSRLAAASGPVSQMFTQERPKPSASRSSWLRPRSSRPLAKDPNHEDGPSTSVGRTRLKESWALRCNVHGQRNRPVCPPAEQTRHRPRPSSACSARSRSAIPGCDRISATSGSTAGDSDMH